MSHDDHGTDEEWTGCRKLWQGKNVCYTAKLKKISN